MTSNNENVVELKSKEELEGHTFTTTDGISIIENLDSAPTTDNEEVEINEEELQQFYEENQDAIDLLGGMEMFESLLALDDEHFIELKDQFLQLYIDTLKEPESENELRALLISQNYNVDTLKKEFDTALEALNEIDFLSKIKIDFLKEFYMIMYNHLGQILGTSNTIIQIPCELEENVKLPIYLHETDAGLDIYAKEEITIAPGETKIIGTGIKTAIPEGYAILIQPRSGQSAKTKLRIANTPGLIDSGYRDEIGVIMENIEPPFKDIEYEFDDNGEIHIKSILHGQSYTISEGQRFAQMRLVQVPKANFVQVESVGDIGENRNGGFGSTDIG